MKQRVCGTGEMSPGEMRVVSKGKAPVVVACTSPGQFYAVRGLCPHQGALLSRGLLWKLTVSNEPGVYGMDDEVAILRCPWHSFDYDVRTGKCIGDAKLRIKTYPVEIVNDEVIVDL